MNHRIIIAVILVGFIASQADAQNRRYRRRGAILGGLAGAAIGVAIGDKGNNETAGALIGGAVGAIAGGTIGNQKDQRIEHNRLYHSGPPQYYQQTPGYQPPPLAYPAYRQPPYPQPLTPAITVADVIQMQHRGISEQTMLGLIQTHGVAGPPSVSQVIDLHEQGVSERVIAAMQGDPIYQSDVAVPGSRYGVPPSPPEPVYESTYGPTIVAPIRGQ